MSVSGERAQPRNGGARPPDHGAALSQAARRSALVGTAGCALHGLSLLTLAIVALVHFGPGFWFFSTLIAVLAFYTLQQAYRGMIAYRSLAERSDPRPNQGDQA